MNQRLWLRHESKAEVNQIKRMRLTDGGVSLASMMLLPLGLSLCLLAFVHSETAQNLHLLEPHEHKLILNLGQQDVPRDCHDLWRVSGAQAPDGLYLIRPADSPSPLVVSCLMRDGGWTVVQHITVNGSVDFDRSWDEYKHGFGSPNGNHWLGNEHLHQLTRGPRRHTLRVKLVDGDGGIKTGEYEPAMVENEAAQYRLRLGLFSGTAADALTMDTDNYLHDNQRFTTKDRDNDNYYQNCARLELAGVAGGGWWYDACAGANLNRRNVIYWQKDCNKERLCKYGWMMVRPVQQPKAAPAGDCARDEL